jgi:hypothetical protein
MNVHESENIILGFIFFHINIAQSNATYMLFVLFFHLPYMFRLVTTIIRGTYHHRNTITHDLFTIQLTYWVWYKWFEVKA